MKEYQQGNTFDCGSFVIENAERAIYQTFVEEDDGSNFEPCHKTDLNGKRDESLINNQQGSTMGPFEVWFKAWEWFMGSIQDPWYAGCHPLAVQKRAKCAFQSSYNQEILNNLSEQEVKFYKIY